MASLGISIILMASACGSENESADTTSEVAAQGSAEPSQDTVSQATGAVDGGGEPVETDVDTSDPTTTIAAATVTEAPIALDEAVLLTAVAEYVAAFGNGDPDAAVSLLSERCIDTIPTAEYRAAVASAGQLYPGLALDEVFDVVLNEGRAVVYYSTEPKVETEEGERWILESDAWVWDDC